MVGYPAIQTIILDSNPIYEIKASCFCDCKELRKLSIAKIELPNYTNDLRFLRFCPNLIDLIMNECFTQPDFKDVSAIADLPNLQKFFMRGVGLIHTTDLPFKMPSLEILDV